MLKHVASSWSPQLVVGTEGSADIVKEAVRVI